MADTISLAVPVDTDWEAFYRCIRGAYGAADESGESEAERLCWEPERSLVGWRDGEIVATAGVYTRRMAVPGAVLPVGHVSLVSVAPTARRQGLMSRMIRQQFENIRAAGEPVAVLWASEGRIYQRFGYGLAAVRMALAAQSLELTMLAPAPTDQLREAAPAAVRELLEKLYDEAYQSRPGWSQRPRPQWDYRLADLASWRGGGSELTGRGPPRGLGPGRVRALPGGEHLGPGRPERGGEGVRAGGDDPGRVRGAVAVRAQHRPDPHGRGVLVRHRRAAAGDGVRPVPAARDAQRRALGPPARPAGRPGRPPVRDRRGRRARGDRRRATGQRRALAAARLARPRPRARRRPTNRTCAATSASSAPPTSAARCCTGPAGPGSSRSSGRVPWPGRRRRSTGTPRRPRSRCSDWRGRSAPDFGGRSSTSYGGGVWQGGARG